MLISPEIIFNDYIEKIVDNFVRLLILTQILLSKLKLCRHFYWFHLFPLGANVGLFY